MSGRGYGQGSRDRRYRHNVPSNRNQSRSRRRRRKQVSNRRLPDRDNYPIRRTARSIIPSTSRLKGEALSLDIGKDDSDSNSSYSRTSGDYDGTGIPDHVWVGEYLDDGDQKDTVPLPYDAAAKEIAYKKAMAEATASVRSLVNPIWLPENMARSTLLDVNIQQKNTRKVLPTEEMPPPMPRREMTSSFPDEAVLKRYQDLYTALMSYQAEMEEEGNQLVNQTQLMSKPAEVYDYGHGENQAMESRERRKRKSSEGSRYGYLKPPSEEATGSDIHDNRDQLTFDRYKNSSRNRYREVEPVISGHEKSSQKRIASPEPSVLRKRYVVPKSAQNLSFEKFMEFKRTPSEDTPHSSGQSLLSMSKPFTFQELCDLQKFLSQPTTPKPSLDEGDENYIPVHTSQDKISEKSTRQEGFPIRVLTSHRRSVVSDEKEDFPRLVAGKSNDGRQPVVPVAPLRIKPILKRANKNVKTGSGGVQTRYPQSTTYKGSFNDTRKVLLDAAKELESRSSKELHDKPLVIVRNAPLGSDSGRITGERRGISYSHKTTGDSLQSTFPFNESLDDSGRKSDTDDEADRRRYERLFAKSRSPTPRSRRYVRSRSPSGSRHHSYTRSRSSSPGSAYREGKRNVVNMGKNSREWERPAETPPRRFVVPPGKSVKETKYFGSKLPDEDYRENYHRQKDGTKDVRGRRGRSPAAGRKSNMPASQREDHCSQSRRRQSPVVKFQMRGRNRDNSPSSSDRSLSRNRVGNTRGDSGTWRQSPRRRESRKAPEIIPQKTVPHDRPEIDLFQISVPADGVRQLTSRQGHGSDGQKSARHMWQDHSPEHHAVNLTQPEAPDRRVEHHESASETTLHDLGDSSRKQIHGDSRKSIKRPPRSESRSTERSVPHPPKRDRKSPPPLWVDEKESGLSDREVRRERRYQHEEMDSILQDEELPGLLSMEVTPLPSLMDVDVSAKPEVKINDERRFASRSVSLERTNSPEESKVLHEERQKKKIITNPKGKIVLKRRDDKSRESKSQGKVSQPEKTEAAKGKAMKMKPKEKPMKKTTGLEKTNPPSTNEAHRISQKTSVTTVNLFQDISNMESLPKNEWQEIYKTWFQHNMQPVLEKNDQAKDLGLQDPVYFLESVTKGNRRSLSFVPRGRAAKEILKFIAVNKKAENTGKPSSKESANGKNTVHDSDASAKIAVTSANSSSATSSSVKSPDRENGNEFFVIDKKPADVKNLASLKTTTQDAVELKEDTNVSALSDKSKPKSSTVDKKKSTGTSLRSNNVPKGSNKSQLSPHSAITIEEGSASVKQLPAASDPAKNNSQDTPTSKQVSMPSAGSEQVAGDEKLEKLDTKELTSSNVTAIITPTKKTCKHKESGNKSRSWQDALLFPEDEYTDAPDEVIKEVTKASSSPATIPKTTDHPSETFHHESTLDLKKQSPPTSPVPGVAPIATDKQTLPVKRSQRRNRSKKRKTTMQPKGARDQALSRDNKISTLTPADIPSKAVDTKHESAVTVASPTSSEIPTEKTDINKPLVSVRRDSSECRPFSKRNSQDSIGTTNSKHTPSLSPPKVESASSPSDYGTSKAEAEFFTEPPAKPELTPEQESLLPDFKRQVDKSALKTLNILCKIENYKKRKVINAAQATLRGFNDGFPNRAASGFTLDHALYYIWCSFQDPTKDALDDVKREMKKIYKQDPCFDVDLQAFLEFQATVFSLCRRNLNRNIRYALQKPSHLKYVCMDSEYAFPQFDGEAHVMIKLWTWRERMYSISRKNTIHRRNSRLKTFPEDDVKPMEERVAKWLRDVLRCKLYDNPESSSCELTCEVKRQLMKTKAHATNQEAVALIVRAWTRNYYNSIENSLSPNSAAKDELMVLDEVYSDESESDANTEDLDIDIEEDLNGVQIDLF